MLYLPVLSEANQCSDPEENEAEHGTEIVHFQNRTELWRETAR